MQIRFTVHVYVKILGEGKVLIFFQLQYVGSITYAQCLLFLHFYFQREIKKSIFVGNLPFGE